MGGTTEGHRRRRILKSAIPCLVLAVTLLLLLCSGCIPLLRWTTDVAVTTSSEYPHIMIPDGSGGTFILWYHSISYQAYTFAQHVDSSGTPLWGSRGVELCPLPSGKTLAGAAADGTGGIVVAWTDNRSGVSADIYAQRIDTGGNRAWGDGIPVCEAAGGQFDPEVVSGDRPGEVIVCWFDRRRVTGSNSIPDIYAQRLNGDGTPMWAAGGVPMCEVQSTKERLEVIPDGGGGAIAAWLDARDRNNDIYAQRIDSEGVVPWPADAVKLAGDVSSPEISFATDELGGALLSWQNWNDTEGPFAQRVDHNGNLLWQADGLDVCSDGAESLWADTVGDGTGGAIVVWMDERADEGDIYAQKITPDGSLAWNPAGVPVAAAPKGQTQPKVTTDGSGGAIVAWSDGRFVVVPPGQPAPDPNYDVFVARVDSSGNGAWGMDITLSGLTQWAFDVIPSGRGGAIVAWAADTNVNPLYAVWDTSVTRVTNWDLSSANQQQLLKEYNRRAAEYNGQIGEAARNAKKR